MTGRTLKVEELGTNYEAHKRVPYVRLKGRWLRAPGLQPGQSVKVTVTGRGVLEIRVDCAPTISEETKSVMARIDDALEMTRRAA